MERIYPRASAAGFAVPLMRIPWGNSKQTWFPKKAQGQNFQIEAWFSKSIEHAPKAPENRSACLRAQMRAELFKNPSPLDCKPETVLSPHSFQMRLFEIESK